VRNADVTFSAAQSINNSPDVLKDASDDNQREARDATCDDN
jgi:hypothetical protein